MGFVVGVFVFLACLCSLNCVLALSSPSQFASLSRVELQALAKQNGIKANIASDKIIALLEAAPAATTTKAKPATAVAKAKPATAPAAVAKAPAAVTKAKSAAAPAASKTQPKTEKQGGSRLKAELASTKPDVARVLDEQGLRISDLLELRKSLEVKQQELDKRPSKTVEKRAAPASSGAGSKKKPANISLKPKPPAVAAVSSGEEDRVVKAPAPAPAPKAPAAPVFEGWTPNFAVSTSTFSGESSFKASSSFKSSTSSSSGGVAAPAASRASLDGVTLEDMLSALIKAIGFEGLFEATKIRAFYSKPSLTSSLKALRAPDMAWGREKVEALYKAKIVARK